MELFLYAKLKYLKWDIFDIVLTLKWIVKIELFWHLTVCKQNLYLYLTELFELGVFD